LLELLERLGCPRSSVTGNCSGMDAGATAVRCGACKDHLIFTFVVE